MRGGRTTAAAAPMLRIGQLAKRSGVPASTLRAWEERYGVIEPARSQSGYRLYSEGDEARVKEMVVLIEAGAAPAEAAASVRGLQPELAPAATVPGGAEALRERLLARLRAFDEAASDTVIDRAVADLSLEAALGELILPVLRRIGELWEAGELSVGEEHFATSLIRGRLLGLARGWDSGSGRRVLLACPQGEMHELGLIVFGLLVRARGWRVTFLGADTPADEIVAASRRLDPNLVVLALTSPEPAQALADRDPLEVGAPLLLAGSSASAELAEQLGGKLIEPSLVEAAGALDAAAAEPPT